MKTFADLGFDNTKSPLRGCASDSFLNLIKKQIPSLREKMVLEAFKFNEANDTLVSREFNNQLDFIQSITTKDEFKTIFMMWEFLRTNHISDKSQLTPEMKSLAEGIIIK